MVDLSGRFDNLDFATSSSASA